MSRVIDMVGRRFGNVTGIRKVGMCTSGDARWEFLCECGNTFEANGYYVRSGKRTSCPDCSRRRAAALFMKHGRTNTPEFSTWTDIQTRCHNENSASYPDYGGRGISVCERWRSSFNLFFADMGSRPSPKHSIDRIDNNGDYAPGNCRWATALEQVRNRRNSAKVTVRGITKPLVEWCEEYGCTPAAAYARRAQGLKGEAIFRSTIQTLEFRGVVDTISGWSRRTGIKASTLTMRVNKYGWPVEKTLTKGVTRCV